MKPRQRTYVIDPKKTLDVSLEDAIHRFDQEMGRRVTRIRVSLRALINFPAADRRYVVESGVQKKPDNRPDQLFIATPNGLARIVPSLRLPATKIVVESAR